MDGAGKRDHVIIQAGGKGTRLEHYTWNKPKCLAPVDGKPLIYHTFDTFPAAKFLIIVDYKRDVISRFLSVFRPDVDFELVAVEGGAGTVSGIREAAALAPDDATTIVVWCDLWFTRPPVLAPSDRVVVGTTDSFPCRWSVAADGDLVERRSDTDGVIGFFAFPRADMLRAVPSSGEFVAWLGDSSLPYTSRKFTQVKEIGTIDALTEQWSASNHARFFNSVEIQCDRVIKQAKLPAYQALLDGEIAWYHKAADLGFRNMPRLLSQAPLTLERIHGRHPFELRENTRGRAAILGRIMDRLDGMHALAAGPASRATALEVYEAKTWQRLENIQALIPDLSAHESFTINGVLCRNILHEKHRGELSRIIASIIPGHFVFAHGDPTFSNIIMGEDGEPYFIDPRGKFGSSWFMGDPNYDWAKLYYSVVGDYDNFNRRRFILEINDNDVVIQIQSGGWSHLKGLLHERMPHRLNAIRILHGLIWLALSGYVCDDYDSILASFFNGLLTLEDAVR